MNTLYQFQLHVQVLALLPRPEDSDVNQVTLVVKLSPTTCLTVTG